MEFIYLGTYISDDIAEIAEGLIKNGYDTNGNITVEDITDDLECYDFDEYDQNIIDTDYDKNTDTVYSIAQCVAGAWDQVIAFVIVKD